MKLIKPEVLDIAGDSTDKVMGRSGELVGFSHNKAVWRYGFLNGSDMHSAFGVHTVAAFVWLMTKHNGKVLDRVDHVLAFSLPQTWLDVINAEVTIAQSRSDNQVH